jgi:hypothetical protein
LFRRQPTVRPLINAAQSAPREIWLLNDGNGVKDFLLAWASASFRRRCS